MSVGFPGLSQLVLVVVVSPGCPFLSPVALVVGSGTSPQEQEPEIETLCLNLLGSGF